MPERDHRPARYAIHAALIYFLIRGLPDLLLYVTLALPGDMVEPLMTRHGAWLHYVYPVVPLYLISVPFAFQAALGTLSVLLVETLLVYLFCASYLRHRPAPPTGKRWLLFILATLLWSLAARSALLSLWQAPDVDAIRAIQIGNGQDLDALPGMLLVAYWKFVPVQYVTTLLWAWLPAWLLCLGRSKSSTRIDAAQPRGARFAGFWLGCILLQTATLVSVTMGLWPWAAERNRIHLPGGFLDGSGIISAVGQLFLGYATFAVAAWFYARRPSKDPAAERWPGLKAVVAGIVVYLLIQLVTVALFWLLAWSAPDVIGMVAQSLERRPATLLVWSGIIGLIILWPLMCWFSASFRKRPQPWLVLLVLLLACGSIPVYSAWIIAGSNMGMAGGRPGLAVTGKLGSAEWRDMEQWCTGVVETSHGTWLIGRREASSSEPSYVPDDVPDLGRLVPEQDAEAAPGERLLGSRGLLTTVSLLQSGGSFKMVGTVPDVACLVVSPQSETLYLITGMNVPRPADSLIMPQTAILQSTDHGANWQWLKSGLMAGAGSLAWALKPVFYSDQEIWAWGSEAADQDEQEEQSGQGAPAPATEQGAPLKPTALFFSNDQGLTAKPVLSATPLLASEAELRQLAAAPDAEFSGRRDMDQTRYVVQVSPDRAYAWVSERMWYEVDADRLPFAITTKADLVRVNQTWQVSKLERKAGRNLTQLETAANGLTHAIEEVVEEKGPGKWEVRQSLVRLDPASGNWTEAQALPSLLPSWLARDNMSVRYFWSNGQIQVISLWGDVVLPRLLAPLLPHPLNITTDAHFYTVNGGRNWHQLAIPGYLGVMGLSPKGSKLYWSQGNSYRNEEALLLQYDLAK